MKILSIGNSFSEDAQHWLHLLAKDNDVELECANLYIGGCSLEMHWVNQKENNAFYDYQVNGNEAEEKISISDALIRDKWDIVTIQQVSNFSGMPDSYEPYLSDLINVIKSTLPDAEIYLHQTWAYEIDSEHSGFANYNNDQKEMHRCIKNTVQMFAEKFGLKILPSGNIIKALRENNQEFDYPNGGLSLCRDGFHLTYDYGRFAAATAWFVTLTGKKITTTEFEDFDRKLLKTITDTANSLI